jgi:ribosomal-protein-alanine N-acetyltransferase
LELTALGEFGVHAMSISFTPLSRELAKEIVSWRYDTPYHVYDYRFQSAEDAIDYLTEPTNHVFAILREGELIGFRSFGPDGRVPGGDYDDPCLDTGGGLRPDLTGQGFGEEVIRKGIEFGAEEFGAERFRVTIAVFNERALKVCKRIGFVEDHRFRRTSDGEQFVVLRLEQTLD